VFAVDVLFFIIYLDQLFYTFPDLVGFSIAFPFIYGPEIFLYTCAIKRNDKTINLSDLIHFLPFILVLIFYIFEISTMTDEHKIGIAIAKYPPTVTHMIILYLIPVHGIIYMIFTLINLKKINIKLKTAYSKIENFEIR
jgi:hypothetical protein